MNKYEIQESNLQFIKTWRYFASKCPQHEILETEDLSFAWGNLNNVLFNAIFLLNIPRNEANLKSLLKLGRYYAQKRSYPWWFIICTDLVPKKILPSLEKILAEEELKPLMKLTGMVTDQILPTIKPNYSLKCQPIQNQETRKALTEINAISYQMRPEHFRQPLETEAFWENHVFGTVGYLKNTPVATAITLWIENKFYVAFVATLPEHRRKGYAQIVIRHCLSQAEQKYGKSRTILHATSMGVPVYQKLGYKPVAYFLTYTNYS